MKKGIWIFTLVFLISCNQGDPVEKKKEQLVKYKEQVVQLSLKIRQLENELGKDTVISEMRLVPVRIKQIAPAVFDHFIEVSGTVRPEEEAFISAEISGQVLKIYIAEGDRVKKGSLLFKLKSTITESSVAEARTQLSLAKVLYGKQKELWNQGVGSEVQYLQAKTNYEAARDRLKTLQAQLDMSLIRAPFNGIIDRIMVKEGELASPGRQLALLINLSRMKIYANVSEQYLNDVHSGDPARVVFPELSDKTIQMSVYRTGLLIDEKSRNFQIEIKFDNQKGEIKPNQFALIRLNDFHTEKALTVPSVIIKQDLNGYFLYKVDNSTGKPVAVKTYVRPGIFYNNQTLVREGLTPGDHVIIDGYNQVSNGQLVSVIQ